MNLGGSKKTRSQRVAGLDPVPKLSTQIWRTITRSDVLLRVALCLLATVTMIAATQAWDPPFTYRIGFTPSRDIVASVDFNIVDPEKLEDAQDDARDQAQQAYLNNPQALKGLRAELSAKITELTEADGLDEETQEIWSSFSPQPFLDEAASPEEKIAADQQWRNEFDAFRSAMEGQRRREFDDAVQNAFTDIDKYGLFEKLAREDGDQTAIIVLDNSDSTVPGQVEVKKVLIANAKFDLDEELQQKLSRLEKEALHAARSKIKQTYVNNSEPLIKLRNSLAKKLQTILNAQQYDDATATIWREFLPIRDEPLPDTEEQKKIFEEFRKALAGDDKNGDLETALSAALGEFEQRGIFDKLKAADEVPEGNREEIVVIDKDGNHSTVAVTEVLLPDIKDTLRKNLEKEFKSLGVAGRIFGWLEHRLPSASTLQYQLAGDGHQQKLVDPALAQRAYYYLQDRLPTTLSLNEDLTEKRKDAAAAAVQPQQVADWYHAGDGEHPLAKANKPLDETTLKLLRAEYNARLEKLTPTVIGSRLLAVLGMYLAIFTLCGLFIYFRYPDVITDLHRFSGLLILAVLAVGLSKLSGTWKTELIPMLLFGMTVAIAYNQELALLMSAVVGLVVVLSLGHGLASFVILMAASATVVLMLRRVRSRVKLVYVGLSAGTVAMLTAIGVNVVENQPLGNELFLDAGLFFLWGVAAGFAMTGLLPFIESVFGVLTEISLLELGDVAHPLLQELVRRAPGTYNHSINVASMAEAAAESIGAKGLLLRVGAYFHDIGKMLKPQYFVENQGEGVNQHESLVPAMSTLIIIAHVKDGADLARQHHLPQPIIDFIQQHHGTTLVQYFYERASENSLSDPDASEVDENTYRYPGPKPQTKEAGILMLADAVESASRVLVEPTPSRIENLVEDIAMKRLLDGQLDQCGLTLQEVRIIQDSLIKSLTAVYHGRVKYPSQRTA